MVPNNVVLSAAVVPLREPSAVDLSATPVEHADGSKLADQVVAALDRVEIPQPAA
jgi:hypothetical protein